MAAVASLDNTRVVQNLNAMIGQPSLRLNLGIKDEVVVVMNGKKKLALTGSGPVLVGEENTANGLPE